MPLTFVRSVHSSARVASHIGVRPIVIPQSVQVSLPLLALDPSSSSSSCSRSISVVGPLGHRRVDIPSTIILSLEENFLKLRIHDEMDRKQRSFWGLTRTLVDNAIQGVSKGYTLELRLVGVGYRAAVEPIPSALTELRARIPKPIRPPRPGRAPYAPPPPPSNRLNMKLGYAHPILVDIPHGITVTTPAPTTISLAGTDKQKLGLLAAKIRRYRPPEPYRGKGIFVGGETIKLKEIKKK